jgi:hypothetical protein
MQKAEVQIGNSGLDCAQYVVSHWNLTNRLETFLAVRFLSWGRPDEQGFSKANYERCAQRIALGFVFVALCMGALPAPVQQPQWAQPASLSTRTPSKPDEKSNGDQNSTSQQQEASPKGDRILWTLPNYLTVENAAHVPPLTTRGKFKLATQDSFDPVEIPFIGLFAGISQVQNSEPLYWRKGPLVTAGATAPPSRTTRSGTSRRGPFFPPCSAKILAIFSWQNEDSGDALVTLSAASLSPALISGDPFCIYFTYWRPQPPYVTARCVERRVALAI